MVRSDIKIIEEQHIIQKHLYRHSATIIAITSHEKRVYSIDKKLCLKVFDFEKKDLVIDISLPSMKGFPVSMSYFDPFNLGYMYLLRAYDNIIAFTCDLGTLVFKVKF